MNPAPGRTLLISVHPKYAKRIFSEAKRIELRKLRPNVSLGTPIAVYVSSPEKQLYGFATVSKIDEGTPDEIWETLGSAAGVSRKEYNQYYKGANKAVAIHFEQVSCLIRPVDLSQIRSALSGFHPPQTYRYLSSAELQTIISSVDNA